MKKILITGGAGFVGRHFTRYFLEKGVEVHCVDCVAPLTGGLMPKDWPLFNPLDYSNFYFYHQDCRDFFLTRFDTDFDYAFHLAAMVGGREMIEHNPLAVAEDLAIDAAYFKWALLSKPSKTVCFSSSAAYPVHLQRPDHYVLLKENMISFDEQLGMPDLTYGWAKLTSEYLAQLAYEKYGLSSVVYRPFSGYGEDQDLHYPFPSICKRVIESAGSSEFVVWGTGDQMRDFIHISDCVAGVITTMDQINDGSAVNLSTGKFTSFKTFAQLATSLYGYSPRVLGLSTKPEGVFARGGDTSKQKSLGFVAKTTFEEGIQLGLSYHESLMRKP